MFIFKCYSILANSLMSLDLQPCGLIIIDSDCDIRCVYCLYVAWVTIKQLVKNRFLFLQVKCESYLPDSSCFYGDVEVITESIRDSGSYTVRHLLLKV